MSLFVFLESCRANTALVKAVKAKHTVTVDGHTYPRDYAEKVVGELKKLVDANEGVWEGAATVDGHYVLDTPERRAQAARRGLYVKWRAAVANADTESAGLRKGAHEVMESLNSIKEADAKDRAFAGEVVKATGGILTELFRGGALIETAKIAEVARSDRFNALVEANKVLESEQEVPITGLQKALFTIPKWDGK